MQIINNIIKRVIKENDFVNESVLLNKIIRIYSNNIIINSKISNNQNKLIIYSLSRYSVFLLKKCINDNDIELTFYKSLIIRYSILKYHNKNFFTLDEKIELIEYVINWYHPTSRIFLFTNIIYLVICSNGNKEIPFTYWQTLDIFFKREFIKLDLKKCS